MDIILEIKLYSYFVVDKTKIIKFFTYEGD
jgi:hypothetical protein